MKTATVFDAVWGGGALLLPGHFGASKFLREKRVKIGGETGVSAGSIQTVFSREQLTVSESADLLASIHRPRHNLLELLLNNSFSLVKHFLGDGLVDLMPRDAGLLHLVPPFEVIDMLPLMRKMVSTIKARPHAGMRIIAWDMLKHEPVLFEGRDYDLAVALAGSCSIPFLAKPVEYTVRGRKVLLSDYGIRHCHPSSFCKRPALVFRLLSGPLLNLVFSNRPCDITIDVDTPGAQLFGRLTKEKVMEMAKYGYEQTRQALSGPLRRRLIARHASAA